MSIFCLEGKLSCVYKLLLHLKEQKRNKKRRKMFYANCLYRPRSFAHYRYHTHTQTHAVETHRRHYCRRCLLLLLNMYMCCERDLIHRLHGRPNKTFFQASALARREEAHCQRHTNKKRHKKYLVLNTVSKGLCGK